MTYFNKIADKFRMNAWFRRSAFGLMGAVLGYSYYYFIGCMSGACPISSNPYISTLYGAGIGFLIPVKKSN